MTDRPTLSAESVTKLTAIFDEDLRQLGDWLGVELQCSTWAEVAAGTPPSWKMTEAP